MVNDNSTSSNLERGLKNRHIQMIALGGAIGSGLFLGSSDVIQSAGPGIILGYFVAGLIAFLIMRQLGEMVVDEPVSGSFSFFAQKYWGEGAGFIAGWNYWILYVLVSMTELTAVGKYIQFWYPEIPTWVSAAVFFALINLANLCNVKIFGELEFWFAIIKVIVVISMIVFGIWLLFSGYGGPQATIKNLWSEGGFLPHGLGGVLLMMNIIMFSFGGLELIGVTAAETLEPQKNIPSAINQILYRILIFYVGSLTVLLSLVPWTRIAQNTSPFVLIFHDLGEHLVANSLNFVVLIAAVSVYNSGLYCTSRMLFGIAKQGNAPRFLQKLNSRNVPINSIYISSLATLFAVLVNYLFPESAFTLLISLAVSAQIINWAMISISHLKFRRFKKRYGLVPSFPAVIYPVGNWLCLLALAFIIIIMLMGSSMRGAIYLIPVWIGVLALLYKLKVVMLKSKST